MNSKVTHLICNAAGGDKYKYAITFRLGVVRPAWVEEAWENRDASEFKATADAFTVQHRLKVFEGQRVCFTGFPADEHKHMEEVLRSNGGIPATIDNPECTHVVSHGVRSGGKLGIGLYKLSITLMYPRNCVAKLYTLTYVLLWPIEHLWELSNDEQLLPVHCYCSIENYIRKAISPIGIQNSPPFR